MWCRLFQFLLIVAPQAVFGQYLGPGDFEFPPIDYDLRASYGAGEHQHGDLRLPEGPGPHPVAVVLHGGCWQGWHTYRHIERLAQKLTEHGWATWNLEHRQAIEEGGGWPGTFLDVGRGTDYLRKVAEDVPLDLSRVVAVGHSAGGHLALWLAARPGLSPDSELAMSDALPIAGAVSLGGVADLRAHFAQPERLCGDGVVQLMGGAPEDVAGRYALGSPMELLPLGVPQLLLHGIDDPSVPVALVERYAQRASELGDSVELVIIDRAGHFEVMAPESDRWPSVEEPLLRFLERIDRR